MLPCIRLSSARSILHTCSWGRGCAGGLGAPCHVVLRSMPRAWPCKHAWGAATLPCTRLEPSSRAHLPRKDVQAQSLSGTDPVPLPGSVPGELDPERAGLRL